MKLIHKNTTLFPQLIILAVIATACEFTVAGQPDNSPKSSLINTIHPATLTAISAMEKPSVTPEPDPMGIPWSDLDGINLEFWYVWDLDEPGEGMNAIVDKFNSENEWGIWVEVVDQGLTLDPIDSIETAFEDEVVPHVMISDAISLAGWFEDGLIRDLNRFMENPVVGFSQKEERAFYPGIYESFTINGGVRPGIPFTQTIQVLYYNSTWGEELGYFSPPGSTDELGEQACAAAAAYRLRTDDSEALEGGMLINPDAANITSWIYAYNGIILEPGEENYLFSSREVKDLSLDWIRLRQDGCGYMIPGYPNPTVKEIEFERFNQRDALIMMNSSQNIDQVQIYDRQTGRPDDWIMIPFPGPDGSLAVTANIQSGLIFRSSPEEELAAWLFLKYLTSPEVQAEWVQYSGYYPTRKDTSILLRDYGVEHPHWAQGLDLLVYGKADPLHSSWDIVRQAVGDAFKDLFDKKPYEVSSLLRVLDQTAAELVVYTQE